VLVSFEIERIEPLADGAPFGTVGAYERVIAKGIVEAHGGKLWAESRPEGGSVFRFSLPIYEVAPA